jgi:hypothetical protein
LKEKHDTIRITFCLDFIAHSIEKDDSKWVRSKAFEQFGEVLHAVYEKLQSPDVNSDTKNQLQAKIVGVSDLFYRIDRIDPSKAAKEEEEELFEEGMTAEDKLIHSFMNQDT